MFGKKYNNGSDTFCRFDAIPECDGQISMPAMPAFAEASEVCAWPPYTPRADTDTKINMWKVLFRTKNYDSILHTTGDMTVYRSF